MHKSTTSKGGEERKDRRHGYYFLVPCLNAKSRTRGFSRSWEKQPGYKADMKRARCVCDMEAGDESLFFACLIGRDAVALWRRLFEGFRVYS